MKFEKNKPAVDFGQKMRIFQIMMKDPCMAEANPASARSHSRKKQNYPRKSPLRKEKPLYSWSLLGFIFHAKFINATL